MVNFFIYHYNRYYSDQWLAEDTNRVAPHMDPEITEERNNCLRKFFPITEDLRKIKQQFADFSLKRGIFGLPDSIDDRGHFDPIQWWGTYSSRNPELKELAFKLLGSQLLLLAVREIGAHTVLFTA